MKKFFSLVLMLLMLTICFTEPFATTIYATQSRAENFSKAYSLTGDAATDMVNIATAQVGKGRYDIGYSEAWCADFVCDCAALAGQSNAIPFDGIVANLYNKVIAAGGYSVSSPQAGDLAFYYCTSAYRWVHVAIMTDNVYSIQGNVNDSVMNIKSSAYWDAYGQTCYNIAYVRPNYSASHTPSNPTISASQNWYSVNDTVSIIAKADYATHYVFALYKDDTRIWEGKIESGVLQYSASQFGEGHFSAYCSCYNSLGYVDTSFIDFEVFGNPEYSSIYSTKQHYDLGETVEITVDTIGTGWQVIGINRLDETGEAVVRREITEEASAKYVIDSNRLGTGQYNAYFSLHNTYGTIDTTLVFFEIGTHAEVEDNAVASTCTTNGLTKGKHCSVCGIVLEEQQLVASSGHTYETTIVNATPDTQGYTLHTCTECGDSYKTDFTDYIDPTPNAPKAVVETKNTVPGSTVTVNITLENVPSVKSMAIRDITYDSSKLELVSGKWNATDAVMASWDKNNETAVIAFAENTKLDGAIFTLTFKVMDDAEDATVNIGCKVIAREKPDGADEREFTVAVISGTLNICSVLRGDVNGDGIVETDDAIHMLRHVMMPDLYTINQDGDFNRDSKIDSDDAVYLLYSLFMPDDYPLR